MCLKAVMSIIAPLCIMYMIVIRFEKSWLPQTTIYYLEMPISIIVSQKAKQMQFTWIVFHWPSQFHRLLYIIMGVV